MLFFTQQGKSKVNAKTYTIPYIGVIPAGAVTSTVNVTSTDQYGSAQTVTTTQYGSEDLRKKINDGVSKYYLELDIYEMTKIDRFLKNPMIYTLDSSSKHPIKPTDVEIQAYNTVHLIQRDDIIKKLFLRLLVLNKHNLPKYNMLAVIRIVKDSVELKIYNYQNDGQFYNIAFGDSDYTIALDSPTLEAFTKYMKQNPQSTFLFINSNRYDMTLYDIVKCFQLAPSLEVFYKNIITEQNKIHLSIDKLSDEVINLTTKLQQLTQQLSTIKSKSMFGRLAREYKSHNTQIDSANTALLQKKTELTEQYKNTQLSLLNKKLRDKIQYDFRNSNIKNLKNMSINFSLGDVVEKCVVVVAEGGNNKIYAKKSRNRHTKQSRKRHTKQSRKRHAKKSRKH